MSHFCSEPMRIRRSQCGLGGSICLIRIGSAQKWDIFREVLMFCWKSKIFEIGPRKKILRRFNNENVQNFFADLFCIFLIFLRSFFKGKVLGKSSISGWDGVPGHNGPLGTPGHNGPLGTHWGPHGPHMGPMLDPCWSKLAREKRF